MWNKWIAAFDVHGDKQSKSANAALFRFMDAWKPKERIAGGDMFDFRPLRGKATQEEQRESMVKDYNSGVDWIKRFRPTRFIRGNHDERLWELAARCDGIRSDYAKEGTSEIEELMEEMKCEMLPYHKRKGILKLGNLNVLHGFSTGIYAARQTALIYGNSIFGHVHTIDEHAIPGLERRVARSCGCLCELDMEYSARQPTTLRHAHGFAYGVVNSRTGDFRVWQAEAINGEWIFPSDV